MAGGSSQPGFINNIKNWWRRREFKERYMIVKNSEALYSYLAFDILIETHQWTTNGPRGVPTTLDAVLRWLQVTVVTSGLRFDGEIRS